MLWVASCLVGIISLNHCNADPRESAGAPGRCSSQPCTFKGKSGDGQLEFTDSGLNFTGQMPRVKTFMLSTVSI